MVMISWEAEMNFIVYCSVTFEILHKVVTSWRYGLAAVLADEERSGRQSRSKWVDFQAGLQ